MTPAQFKARLTIASETLNLQELLRQRSFTTIGVFRAENRKEIRASIRAIRSAKAAI